MKKNNQNRNMILTFVVLLFFFATPAIAAPVRVAILPFDVHAQNDLTFLQQGILDMLASRLSWPDQVEVINKKETQTALSSVSGFDGESRALLIGGKLQANYVLFGSLTVFGESVSIDAKMVDVSGQKAPLPFYAQTSGMGEVIPQINQFATTINATVFGRAVAPSPGVASPQAGRTAQQTGPQAYNPRMHPEKLLQNGIQSEGQYPVMGQPYAQTPNPAFIATAPAYGGSADSFWRSQRFKSVITGIDMGDVDKDGQLETVVVTVDEILIYRNQNQRMVKIADLEKINTHQYMGVDVGDINGNGYPEIFISAISPRKDAFNSFILEYDGSEFKRIATDLPWHFRIVKTGVEGDFLIGQKEPPSNGNLLSQPIFRMSWMVKPMLPEPSF
ncbi:FG-GAP repeat domain-containing protein [Desulfosarcina cetonica]|uniref:FG-GAP repeat domain-containing protein n=1 Tax=Desulfosarcina cetonica TaxID=90730 RepID=UPI0006D1D1E1|nr:VCBS repeat-containing protein [Desulfosarcina cetonica]